METLINVTIAILVVIVLTSVVIIALIYKYIGTHNVVLDVLERMNSVHKSQLSINASIYKYVTGKDMPTTLPLECDSKDPEVILRAISIIGYGKMIFGSEIIFIEWLSDFAKSQGEIKSSRLLNTMEGLNTIETELNKEKQNINKPPPDITK